MHAGFGANADGIVLFDSGRPLRDPRPSVLSPPRHRRELAKRAEEYLRGKGTNAVCRPGRAADPFFFGLYGGSCPVGFLESDPDAAPFLTALGYEPVERYAVLECDLSKQRSLDEFSLPSTSAARSNSRSRP